MPAEALRAHDVTLQDGDLVLRPLTEDDWHTLATWALDADVLFLAELEAVEDRTLEELQTDLRAASLRGVCWVVELAGVPIGDARLTPVEAQRVLDARTDEAMWRLEVALLPGRWGQQLGRRAARLACNHAFEALDADSVWAHLGDHNPRAIRMLYHLGFSDAGMRHQPPGRKAFRAYDLALERASWERTRS
jgi:RimJ/RimL family protein N-acetyltransferase